MGRLEQPKPPCYTKRVKNDMRGRSLAYLHRYRNGDGGESGRKKLEAKSRYQGGGGGKNLYLCLKEGKREQVIGREKMLSDVVSRPARKVCYITIWPFQVSCRTGLVKTTNTVNDSHMENVLAKIDKASSVSPPPRTLTKCVRD